MSRIKNRFFIVFLSVAVAIALFGGVFAVMGWGSLLGDLGSAVIYPFQWVFSRVGDAASGFVFYFRDMNELRDELDSLKAENESLKAELLDAEILADEHAWLYHYLSIKETHEDYGMCAASVISSVTGGESSKYITELTLNQGSMSGIQTGMPVITPRGLVGVVVEVSLSHCRVSTVLDTSVSVGAVTTRSTQNGLCEGDYARIHNGCATLRYLPEESDVQAGDIVVTSGRGSVYPYGIPIGRVTDVSFNAYSRTTEATIQPFTDFSDLSEVIIMTSYTHYVDGYDHVNGGGT